MIYSTPFAERTLDLVKQSGERLTLTVQFGPIYKKDRDFRCKIAFIGWGESPPDIWGADSLQALISAITLVHSMLHEFVVRGGRVLYPGTEIDFDLEGFLTSPEYPRSAQDVS
ncbi:DUF6968 family protein [Pedosphaera parvula]|uniref:DUF6968 domain-containing protein n=1 Tax=Pedosphaera parvula (strain Ellin514) TaxID=320771 RepID=B9XRC1_PEDPL|nr:hypothetical protein Cflav_PD0476 [Pedosphaera parvula Ellin514]